MKLPEAFEEKIKEILGDEFPAFLESLKKDPVISIRLNPFKVKRHPSLERVQWAGDGFFLRERPVFTLDPLFHAGAYYVQEANSMFIEQIWKQHVTKKEDMMVLDLCAAPGGKSTHILSLMQGKGLLVSNEVIKTRAGVLDENIRKWGCFNTVVTQNDPEHFESFTGLFDVVVVDAPCSGEGLFRKDEAARGQWSEENVDLCSLRQKRILSHIWPVLKPGGILIYSTCTFNREEDEVKVEHLIKEMGAELLKVDIDPDWGIEETKGYKFFPHRTSGEGFFISALKKQEGETFLIPKIRKRKAELATPKEITETEQFILIPEGAAVFRHNEKVILFPERFSDNLELFISQLHVWNFGLHVGEEKGKNIAPTHDLAISPFLREEAFTIIGLNLEQALLFQQKNTFDLPEKISTPYILFTFQEVPIGIGKVVGNRFNNLYPKEWRIRMSFNKEQLRGAQQPSKGF